MPSNRRQRENAKAREQRAMVNAAGLPPKAERWPSEREMMANVDKITDRVWSSTANRPDISPYVHKEKGARVGGRKAAY